MMRTPRETSRDADAPSDPSAASAANTTTWGGNHATDILKMISQLESLVDNTRVIMRKAYGLDTDEFYMLINKIRASLPDEVKKANRLTRDSQRIVDTAREEADQTVEQARQQAEQALELARQQAAELVSKSEIVQIATAQAKEIIAHAEREAHEVRDGADEYAREVLANLENFVAKVMGTIQRGRQKLDER